MMSHVPQPAGLSSRRRDWATMKSGASDPRRMREFEDAAESGIGESPGFVELRYSSGRCR